MSWSLTGMTTLGNITTEESNKSSNLFNQEMPGRDSEDAILLDIFGTSREININGIYVPTTSNEFSLPGWGSPPLDTDAAKLSANLKYFILELDELANGEQTQKNYESGTSGITYLCLVQSVTWNVEMGAINKVNYSISLVEGKT